MHNGAMNALDSLPPHPLTVACVPLMGGAASLGLGLALAQPDRRVLVLDGDASLLMELGGLVSVAQAAPENYYHFLFNNGVQFSGLGNLPTPAYSKTSFTGLAQASGYTNAYYFESNEKFSVAIAGILKKSGPIFIELKISSDSQTLGLRKPSVEMTDSRFSRMGEELRRIRETLGIPHKD